MRPKPMHMLRSALVGLGLLVGTSALAVPGEGLRVGETTFSPAVTTGLEFRSNPYLSPGRVALRADQSTRPVGREVVPALAYYLRPEFMFRVDNRHIRVNFSADYRLRSFLVPTETRNLNRFNDFTVNLGIDALRRSPIGIYLNNGAATRNQPIDTPFQPTALLFQFRNQLRGGLIARPSPDVDIRAGAEYIFRNFRLPRQGGTIPFNARNTIGPHAEVRWRFLPRTAVVIDASYQRHTWRENWVQTGAPDPNAPGALGRFLAIPDSQHIRGLAGLRGQVTEKLSITGQVGYGVGLYDAESVLSASGLDASGDNEANPARSGFDANVSGAEGILAVVRAEYDSGFEANQNLGQRLHAEYRKDFLDMFFTNYLAYNGFSLGLSSRWTQVVATDLTWMGRVERYNGEVERRDFFQVASLGVHFDATRWFRVTTSGRWIQRASSETPNQYDDFQAMLLLSARY